MKLEAKPLATLYILQALTKGLSTSYFVLLPVFYAKKLIGSAAIGYIGAAFIVALIIGAVAVARRLHSLSTGVLFRLAAAMAVVAGCVLLAGTSLKLTGLLTVAYVVMGLAMGLAMSAIGALSASLTVKGERFRTMAKLWMLVDVIRIVAPILIAGMVIVGGAPGAVAAITFLAVLYFVFTSHLPRVQLKDQTVPQAHRLRLRRNRAFSFTLAVEFLDSFASSQLFVYLPLLLLSKGYSLEKSLLLQTFVFSGYFCGRWLVGLFAERYSGIRAVAYAEVGMAASIIALLLVKPLWALYAFSFIFGIFARGTSPAISALAFDTLHENQTKRGSALIVVAGDSGSALGQLFFGLLIAWFSVKTPFVLAVVVAGVVAAACLARPRGPAKLSEQPRLA